MTWKNFAREEFSCKCGCDTNEITDELIDYAQEIRTEAGFALPVTSGYRCPNHKIERDKKKPGTHAKGLAVDFGIRGEQARIVTRIALTKSRGGVGINQKGLARFVHVDIGQGRAGRIWTY